MAERTGPLTSGSRPTHCDVCAGPLSIRTLGVTGLCATCLGDGASFARAWMADLLVGGGTSADVAEIVGTTGATVRARVSERRGTRA